MNVLLLTDFSSGARHAHKYALNLFSGQDVNYYLLHSHYNTDFKDNQNLEETDNLKREMKLYNYWGFNESNLSIIKTSKRLIDAIRHLMKSEVIDLVVMGASGNSNRLTNQLGNNTSSTATKIKCPVLIVFEESVIKEPLNVAFPVDYTDQLQVNCVKKIKSLPTSHNFTIEVFEINSKTSAHLLTKYSKQILQKGLDKLNIIYKKNENFNICQLETHNKKDFDLISFAAKNLSVYNKVFNQLKNLKDLKKHPPLYILHA